MLRELAKKTVNSEIAEIITPGASVLDIGCGEGDLLKGLVETKQVIAQGVDIREASVLSCIKKGIPAIHGDLNEELSHCRDGQYDFAVLSRTLQVVLRPDYVLKEIVRIGRQAIVAFPNFAHLSIRFWLLFRARMPKSEILPFEWYDTPNIHNLTIRDFHRFCRNNDIEILKARYFGRNAEKQSLGYFPNFFAKEALFVIRQK